MPNTHGMLLVTSNFPPEVGGPAKFTSEFSRWLQRTGIDCSIITTGPKLDNWNNESSVISISRNQNLLIRFIKASLAMTRYGKGKPALVNGLFYEALLANLLFRFKFTAKVPSDIVWDRARNKSKTSLDVDSFQGKERGVYRIQRWAFTRSLKVATRVIVPSNHLASLTTNWGIPREKIFLIRNSQTIPSSKPKVEPKFDVISVGRLLPLKGNRELIDACAQLGYSLRILGEGPEEEELRQLASNLNSGVEFLGSLDNSQVISHVQASRVFVLNSSHEGSPNALIEAMAQGSVCVVRENPGTMELIKDLENGVLVGKSRTLNDALKLAITENTLREKVSNGAFEFARKELNQDVNFTRILHACG